MTSGGALPPERGRETRPLAFAEAIRVAQSVRDARAYPGVRDARSQRHLILPRVAPKFTLAFDSTSQVFTIGSCFARNIEEALARRGVILPTTRFAVPRSEWLFRPNGLLNEYNPGTIAQRILWSLDGRRDPPETIVANAAGYVDLLLQGGEDVTLERAQARREDIFEVYSHLAGSQVVVVTLGYVEAWYDHAAACYLNRMPPLAAGRRDKDRFEFRTLSVSESLAVLEPAIEALAARGIKVVLTVSPVPISSTFRGMDCVIANEYSKSVLRVCAEALARERAGVDYFPSYEIVRSGGLRSYIADHVHVDTGLVADIVDYMVAAYTGAPYTMSRGRRAPWWRRPVLDAQDAIDMLRRKGRRAGRALRAAWLERSG